MGFTERPEYLLSVDALNNEPEKMYKFVMENMYFPQAMPNIIHQKMADLTKNNKAKIITQNVDELHQKAGSINVIDYHGSLYDIFSVKSHQKASFQEYKKSMYLKNGELLRPGITLYGEVPLYTQEAMKIVNEADLVVIVGTSFVVYPFAALLDFAQSNTPIYSINLETINTNRNIKQIIDDAVNFFESLSV